MRARMVRDTQEAGDLPRLRPAFPALDRPGLQGRPEQRRLPADHLRRRRGSAGAGRRNTRSASVKAAQARGDFDVLAERGRRALRVHLAGGVEPGLPTPRGAPLEQALK